MEHWTASFSNLDKTFLLTGAIGTIVVVYRVVALFLGSDLDGDDFGDVDGHPDGGSGFQVLSVHGLSSFLMMFGLVGLALSRQSKAGMGLSLLGGLLAGMAAIWIIARVFRLAVRLQSSGNIHPQAAAGCLGTVYLTIPATGTGRVNVRIGKRLREMDAMAAEGVELPTGTSVRVIRVEQSLAVVEPLAGKELE